jgi:hypothetical protein
MLALAVLALLALGGAHAAAKSPAVSLLAPPKVKANGDLNLGFRTSVKGPFAVDLQQLRSGRWHTIGSRSLRGDSAGKIAWKVRTPLPYVTLRASIRAGDRTTASARRRVRVVRDTRTLRPTKILAAPDADEVGRVRYRGSVNLEPGDIVAARTGPETPAGFLGLVTSVSQTGQVTQVATRPTTLLAAVPSGSIDVQTPTGSGASTSADRHGVSRTISCTKGGTVSVGGSVSVAPTASLQAKWSLFHGVTSARFEAGVKMDEDLTASAQAAASCKVGPVTLAQWALEPIDVQVGPIPVVFIPVIKLVLEGDGAVSAQVSTGLHGNVTATGGIAYEDGNVHPVGGVTHSMTFDAPAPSAKAHLGANIGPTVALLLYGIAGPEVDLRAGLAFDADTAANPWWKLTAPIDLGAKLSIPALGLQTDKKSVYHKSFLLAQAAGPFAPAPAPKPAPPPGGIVYVGAPRTSAPPSTLGPYAMHPFGLDVQELGYVSGVDGPTGHVSFSTPLNHLYANEEPEWKTWSHGYEDDVYASFEEPGEAVALSLPPGTKAFYLYAEPTEFATFDFTVKTQDGTSSGAVPVYGEYGAEFFGFYANGGATIQSVTVECPEDSFAIGEFGISSG